MGPKDPVFLQGELGRAEVRRISSSQTGIGTSGAVIQFNDVLENDAFEWDSVNYRLVAKRRAIVVAYTQIRFSAVNVTKFVSIRKNGTLISNSDVPNISNVATGSTLQPVKLEVGDYIDVTANTGASTVSVLEGSISKLVVQEIQLLDLTTETLAKNSLLQFEERILSADFTTNNAVVTNLTVSNLVIGKKYHIAGYIAFLAAASDTAVILTAKNGSTVVGSIRAGNSGGSATSGGPNLSIYFTATSNTLTFETSSFASGTSLRGSNTKEDTFIQVQEIPFSQTALFGGAGDYEFYIDTPTGHGSTDTAIRDFLLSNTRKNTGQGIFWNVTRTAANGLRVEILQDGNYSIYYTDRRNASNLSAGISVNASALTTNISDLSYSQGKRGIDRQGPEFRTNVSLNLYLKKGDIVRCHTSLNADDNSNNTIFQLKFTGY